MSTYKGFSQVQLRKPPRSKFNLSHEKKLSTRMGKLVPILCCETLPNDTFSISMEVMARFAPLLAPIYHRVNVFIHVFFVPIRLLYKDWEKLITNGRLGTEMPPVSPWIGASTLATGTGIYRGADIGSLWDYLGGRPIPNDGNVNDWDNTKVSTLPFAAYYKIWYDYYRDRNYVADNEDLPLPSGDFVAATYDMFSLKTRSWQHDRFTSALPWTQRGNEVLIPMEGEGSVNYYPQSDVLNADGSPVANGWEFGLFNGSRVQVTDGSDNEPARIENIDSVSFENSSVSINDFRTAIALQQWLERNALAGSRYNESIMAHFNRKTSDGRLQRGQYLGGLRLQVQIGEVLTNAYSEDADANVIPPAQMTGRGISYGSNARIRYNCEEHGFIMGIMSVMPTSAYMQGIPQMFLNRQTFLDYPWPSFAKLGEEPVYQYEVFATPANTDPVAGETVFGYQSRYSDWKWMPSTAHGDFRQSLDFWHLDRKFDAAPNLGADFVTFEDQLQDRIFAVAESDTIWCYIHNSVFVTRSLPYFAQPSGLV